MIRTRLAVGAALALAAAGVLVGDDHLTVPGLPFPCLFACLMLMGVLGPLELLRLLPEPTRPSGPLVPAGVLLCLAANWYPPGSVWGMLVAVSCGVLVAAFVVEIARYDGEPGRAVPRVAATVLAVGYLGVLPVFFAQTRFLSASHGALLLALTIAVPKGNDVFAFFTGRFLGRHPMAPRLSPKKTWEGFAGGMAGGAAVAVGIDLAAGVFPGGMIEAAGFGLAVGLAGVFGDLAESVVKRDGLAKDASKAIPGFGGLLDVVDSVLFAAPVAYLWFLVTLRGPS
ncbi:MAG: phosphatidate cytidylyltransferase [Isosphaera sp.]|nr:phosphatidate cytidylyltransferase [Isosphaera sp.]